MNYRDGLDRDTRERRADQGKDLSVLDTNLDQLIDQAINLSGIIRYYNLQNHPEGYFDNLLKKLKSLTENGSVEPSVALVHIFLENLRETTTQFNQQWRNYPEWYLKNILRVRPLSKQGNKIWLRLEKIPFEQVKVRKDTRFVTRNEQQQLLYYKVAEDVELSNTALAKSYIINLTKDSHKIPESYLDMVTSVNVNEVQIQANLPVAQKTYLKTIGIKMTSPALLLREGQRLVTLNFYCEKGWQNEIVAVVLKIMKLKRNRETDQAQNLEYEGLFYEQIFNNIFYLTISTTEGWTPIPNYTFTKLKKGVGFELKFTFDEKFPSTEACSLEKHKFISKFPKLNIHLNFDAWMYPYSWIEKVRIEKIEIKTEVHNINNIQVYNELGKIDLSTAFPPFGIRNRKGSWMAVGNYEMAIKHTKKINLNIRWGQLPEHNEGLYGYYKQYGQNINNASFTFSPAYLNHYEWERCSIPGTPLYLFATEENEENNRPKEKSPLYHKTCIAGINISKMPPIKVDEEHYEYTQQTRSGFISFMLQTPDMGFGEDLYHKLFAEKLIEKAKKKYRYPTVNPPINPLIERITLSYEAEDTLNFNASDHESKVDYILPVDTLDHFPENTTDAINFAVQLDEVNLLMALKDVELGKTLDIFFDFKPDQVESLSFLPSPIQWYIGHMRNWKPVPETFLIQKDETMHLSISGRMRFQLPHQIAADLYDHEGFLWIRAGIKNGQNKISMLKSVAQNPVLLQLDDKTLHEDISFNSAQSIFEPEENIPGVIAYQPLTSFFEGRANETDKDMMIRISEYITHQGKAITRRDYERLLLQEFPDIGKALCYKKEDENPGTISIAVLPALYSDKPMVSNYLMIRVEQYLNSLTTQYVKNIEITNPSYEQILVRMILKKEIGIYLSQKKLKDTLELIHKYIAPWQVNKQLPKFGYSIPLADLYHSIETQFKDKGVNIYSFEIFCFSKEKERYEMREYKPDTVDKNTLFIRPSKANTIFIPAAEHIIHIIDKDAELLPNFGINEMSLGDTFIIN